MVALGAGDVSASQTAGAGDLDTLGRRGAAVTGLHGIADSLLHGAAESDTALQLRSDVLSNQLSVGGSALDLDDVEVDGLAGQLCELLLDLSALSTALADNDTGLSAEDIDLNAGCAGLAVDGTLDLDLGDASSVQLLLQGLADLVILDQGVAECLLRGKPAAASSYLYNLSPQIRFPKAPALQPSHTRMVKQPLLVNQIIFPVSWIDRKSVV